MINSKFYIGVVEDRFDPLKLGRCKVRVFGIHSESKELLPTKDLPWCLPISPITSASISGIGISPLGPIEGTWVILIFLDGDDMQQPAMFGTIASNNIQSFEPVAKKPQVENKDTTIIVDSEKNPIPDGDGKRISIGNTKAPSGWYLGKTSEKYESGGKGAGVISSRNSNDYGGSSYGTYQFASYLPKQMSNGNSRPSSKNSPLIQYINNCRWKERFTGLTPATNEFDSVWKNIASETKNPDRVKDLFWQDQHDFIKRKYYDVCIANVQRAGIDLSKFGPSVQDIVWSTAVQLGPANTKVFTTPLRDKSQLSDIEIVQLVSQYKIANVGTLFKSSSESIRNSVKNRWIQEEQDLLKLAKDSVA